MNSQSFPPYKIYTDPLKRTCEITFFFDDGASYTLPTRYYPGIENDVRMNYYAWRAHAVAYSRERSRIDNALNALTAVEFRGGDDLAQD